MRIGVPTEIKEMENRVGATPAGVGELVRNGHQVCVEKDAGEGSGFNNAEYEQAGAKMVDTAAEVWASEMVYKVKEPLPAEYGFFPGRSTIVHLSAFSRGRCIDQSTDGQ